MKDMLNSITINDLDPEEIEHLDMFLEKMGARKYPYEDNYYERTFTETVDFIIGGVCYICAVFLLCMIL